MKEYYSDNVHYFKKDDEAFLKFIKRNGGYVYNDFGGSNIANKKLHHYDCAFLHNLGGGSQRTSVGKACSGNRNDLLAWLRKKSKEYSECPCIRNNFYSTVDFDRISNLAEETKSKKNTIFHNIKEGPQYTSKEINLDKAKEFALKLIDIYNNEKIPLYVKHYKKAGFTGESLTSDKDKLFQMIILASYDQQPFTRVARGWEPIWFELPEILMKLNLYSLKGVKESTITDIENRLRNTIFYNYHIDSKGTPGTSCAETFKNTATLCEVHNLLNKILCASSSSEVKEIQGFISKGVKNIGKMIASKIIMYVMREIKIGKAEPQHFDLIVDDLLGEYHNNKIIKEIETKRGEGFISEVIKILKELGDPLSIDALYFIDRDAPQLKKELP